MKFLVVMGFLLALDANAETVTFTIPPGTTETLSDWNDPADPLHAKVGDTLVVINGDSKPHQLHTNDRPCDHGELIPPGGSWACVLTAPYDSREDDDPIRDHIHSGSKFWLVVKP